MILLARHGETADNAPPQRFMGSRDTPLNARGRAQAHALARAAAAAGLEALWTSHLLRARETAEVVGAALGLAPRVDERLAESHRGRWEGRLVADIEREEPEGWAAWLRAGPGFRFPGGESLGEHQRRALAAARHPRGLDAFHELAVPNGALLDLDDLGRWTHAA